MQGSETTTWWGFSIEIRPDRLESIEVIRETENRLQLLNKRWEKKKSKSGLWFRTKHEATVVAVDRAQSRLSCARADVVEFREQLADARRLEREART